jgi:Cft2 family RNA processing exonuclease
MAQIQVVPLGRSAFVRIEVCVDDVGWIGAGQDVGRSCVLVSIGGKNIMFDCGMHMGYNDERRFPDFSYISKTNNFDQILDCVIITHL